MDLDQLQSQLADESLFQLDSELAINDASSRSVFDLRDDTQFDSLQSLKVELEEDKKEVESEDVAVETREDDQIVTKLEESSKKKSSSSSPSASSPSVTQMLVQIIATPPEELAWIGLAVGVAYFFLSVFSIHFNLSMFMIIASFGFIIVNRFKAARKKGFINKLPKGIREVLFRRSIFDILCDLWYFPILPKYLKAIIGPFIFKNPPELTVQAFEELHPKFKQAVLTKGVINILPNSLKNLLLPEDILDIQEEESAHNVKQTRNQMERVLKEVWGRRQKEGDEEEEEGVIVLREKKKTLDTIVVKNSEDVQRDIRRSKLANLLEGKMQTKYDKAEVYHQLIDQKEISSTFAESPILYLSKFLKGSRNVSSVDRRKIKRALLFATIALGTQMYFSKITRKWMKYTMLFILYSATISVSAGSFILLAKHAQKQAALIQVPVEEKTTIRRQTYEE